MNDVTALHDVARTLNNIRTGDVHPVTSIEEEDLRDHMATAIGNLVKLANASETIEATALYEQVVQMPEIDLYNHFVLMPVWPGALIAYQNEHGNVNVIQVYAMSEETGNAEYIKQDPPYAWETENPVDWSKVTHRFVAVLWLGGRSKGKPISTLGPVYRWDVACYEGGVIADIRWTSLYDFPSDEATLMITQNPMLVWMQAYTLAGCVNVELVEPKRKRTLNRQLDRIGVRPKTIIIKRTSKSYRHDSIQGGTLGADVPQSFVRGHYAYYGPEYGRGLLFGKYGGKFWIPAHARGSIELEPRSIDYQVDAE